MLEPPTEEMRIDPHEVVRTGDEAIIVEISDDYPEDFQDGLPTKVTLIADESKRSTQVAMSRLSGILGAYIHVSVNLDCLREAFLHKC